MTDYPPKLNIAPDNLIDWLAWAYWEMRNNYFTLDNKFAQSIQHDALIKLARAWELAKMEKEKT